MKEGDYLIPDKQVMREFSVSAMTIWRWTNDVQFGFPPAIRLKNRNYRLRSQIEAFKERLLTESIRSTDARIDAMNEARRARRLDRVARREGRRQT